MIVIHDEKIYTIEMDEKDYVLFCGDEQIKRGQLVPLLQTAKELVKSNGNKTLIVEAAKNLSHVIELVAFVGENFPEKLQQLLDIGKSIVVLDNVADISEFATNVATAKTKILTAVENLIK